MSKFIELTVHTTSEGSELVADCMWNYTAFGVVVSDANDIIELQKNKKTMYWDYIDENAVRSSEDVLVKCYLPLDGAAAFRKAIMEDVFSMRDRGGINFGSLEDSVRTVDGDEWQEVWKEHFRPIRIGKIVVVPEWIEYKAAKGEKIILLDSNMAFGTGEHETTAMCIKLMQGYIKPNSVCVDVGCGSGILGIGAVILGAKKAYLIDVDPVAVDSARHNAALNGVEEKVSVSNTDLEKKANIESSFGGMRGDVVLANITAEILCRLSAEISTILKDDGVLILSGIIEDRLPMVKVAFLVMGLRVIKEVKQGEWFALVLKKKGHVGF